MITAMNRITLAVTDIENSFLFYKNIVGLHPFVKWDKGAYFTVGDVESRIATKKENAGAWKQVEWFV